ncbi:MAG: gamma-glutamyl-gamma-aminobutyrate hydrolase family protein [Streptosporangiales bacterium]|nr:gamma-glutamyl-gamma-aminobutyrate hydrolase family protein [Streptosporangiales bacterium]
MDMDPSSQNRPVVGLTAYVETARWGAWETTATLVPHRYVASVAAAGGIPVVLPPVDGAVDGAGALLDRLDGLVLVGGGDIDPARYDAEPHPRTAGVRDFRDSAEFALAAAALERGLPLLGICRGMQVLNVLRGGTLHQHLPDLVGTTVHSPAPGSYGQHPVRIAPGSLLAKVLGRYEATVPTHHHQAVDRPGAGITPVAWAEDGVIEAIVVDDHPFALAVEWHPEVGDDPSLFEAFVAAAHLA